MTGIRSENMRRQTISSLCERHRVYLINLHNIAYYTPRLYGI